ncbi:MAG: alpha/beta hydrolase [candidate division Zixibacteria bacterium]|nr:alpha/beta hydrolase [candidate division Zixibacteria bacterium]
MRVLAERNHDIKIPTIPQILVEVLRVVRDESSSFNDLVTIIKRDPPLSASILSLANSVYYGGKNFGDPSSACDWIGRDAVAARALSSVIFATSSKWRVTIDKSKFWRHSIEVAICARSIAKKINHKYPEELYTCGLLHDIGILYLNMYDKDEYSRQLKKKIVSQRINKLEDECLCANHAKVGQDLLREWGLPKRICKAIGQHHNICYNKYMSIESCIIALANIVSTNRIIEVQNCCAADLKEMEMLQNSLKLDSNSLKEIQLKLPGQVNTEASFLELNIGSEKELLLQANRRLLEILMAKTGRYQSLANRIDKLKEEFQKNNPNVVIIHADVDRRPIDNIISKCQDAQKKLNDNTNVDEIMAINQMLFDLVDYVDEQRTILHNEFPEKESGEGNKSFGCQVWFGTNRKPKDIDDINKGFSNERDDLIHFGKCMVYIPKSHKIGALETTSILKISSLIQNCITLEEIKQLKEETFWKSINNELRKYKIDDQTALIFLHGFNTSFKNAALRAAQLHYDLKIPGITAFFSWPSQDSFLKYPVDEASIGASEKYIEDFLIKFASFCEAKKVHIIAHSMGNRALLRSIRNVTKRVNQKSNIPFSQIILAAPDIDTETFKALAGAYRKAAKRTTLYVSSRDWPLFLSKELHGHSRVGKTPPVVIVEWIDTIEASEVNQSFTGHGYFSEKKDLLHDIKSLFQYNLPPDERIGLISKEAQDGIYWKMQ